LQRARNTAGHVTGRVPAPAHQLTPHTHAHPFHPRPPPGAEPRTAMADGSPVDVRGEKGGKLSLEAAPDSVEQLALQMKGTMEVSGDSKGEPFVVHVKTLIGKSTALKVSEHLPTGSTLRRLMEAASGISAYRQMMIFRGKPLLPTDTLKAAGIKNGDTVNVIIKIDKTMVKLEQMVRLLNSENPEELLTASQTLRKMLSIEKDPPIQQVINAGAIPGLVKCLKMSTHTPIQFEACWAITNIASGTLEQTAYIVHTGVLKDLSFLVNSENQALKEQALWALGNIAGDVQFRDAVLRLPVIEPTILACMPTAQISLQRTASWVLSNFVRVHNQAGHEEKHTVPKAELVRPIWRHAMRAIATNGWLTDEMVVSDLMFTLYYCATNYSEARGAILSSKPLVDKILDPNVLNPSDGVSRHGASNASSAKIVSALTVDPVAASRLVEMSLVPKLGSVLGNNMVPVKKESKLFLLKTTRNISALKDPHGTLNASVISAGLHPFLLTEFRMALATKNQKNLTCTLEAVSNFIGNADLKTGVSQWVENGAIVVLVDGLDWKSCGIELCAKVAKTAIRILKAGRDRGLLTAWVKQMYNLGFIKKLSDLADRTRNLGGASKTEAEAHDVFQTCLREWDLLQENCTTST